MATHNKLGHHAGNAQQKDAHGINQDEGGATILAGHIGKTPNVA